MQSDTFTFKADDATPLHVYRFLPAEGTPPRAVVHIAHGMAEHAARYSRVAAALVAAGYAVYANDHRGHGKTAKSEADLGFLAPANGLARAVRDLEELIAHEKAQHPAAPLFLFGHSMGSYMTQRFMIEHGATLRGAVLSGTGGKPDALAAAGRFVARAERWRLGARGRSNLLTTLSFGQFNRQFSPTRTECDWLSRDPDEVDKYVSDPLCGFSVSTALWVDLLTEIAEISRPENQSRVPKDLPVYLFSGSRDPVGANTKSVEQLIFAYRAAGIKDITHRFYPDGRHEMLNETNRDEVTKDLIAWLDRVLAG